MSGTPGGETGNHVSLSLPQVSHFDGDTQQEKQIFFVPDKHAPVPGMGEAGGGDSRELEELAVTPHQPGEPRDKHRVGEL